MIAWCRAAERAGVAAAWPRVRLPGRGSDRVQEDVGSADEDPGRHEPRGGERSAPRWGGVRRERGGIAGHG